MIGDENRHDSLPHELEQALRNSGESVASELGGKLNVENGLAAIIRGSDADALAMAVPRSGSRDSASAGLMKFRPGWRDDGGLHEYCANKACHAEGPEKVRGNKCVNTSCDIRETRDAGTHFFCPACGQCSERRVVLDSHSKWWVADDGVLWHESSGVFVRNPDGRFLFCRRTISPADTLTVPSGHVDKRETPVEAAVRELGEQIAGLPHVSPDGFVHIATEDITGDSCRRGSDAHRWHVFLVLLDSQIQLENVIVGGEGSLPVLLTLASAKALTLSETRTGALPYLLRHVIDRHAVLLEGDGIEPAP